MKRLNILPALAGMCLLGACLKDKGNYTYKKGNDVTMRVASYSAIMGDTITITATRTYSNPNDTADFDHAWYVDGKLVGTDPVLKFVCKDWGSLYGTYYMTDRKSGNVYALVNGTPFFITVSPATMYGWGILYEQNGKSELGHVRINTTTNQYFDYKDLYKNNNNGEELGSGPVKIRDFQVSGGRGMYVIQRGGQGCVEIEAYTLQKKLPTSKAFIGGMPADFAPVDMAFQSIGDLLINDNGKVYGRFFNGALPFTVPFMSNPLTIPKGMLVSDIWDSWGSTTTFCVMYDKLNKRLLRYKTNIFSTGGGITIDTVPAPASYPADFTSLQNFGDWEYVWGGSFNDINPSMDCAMILRNPADQQLYYETFNYAIGPVEKVTPKKRILFPANSYITPNTKYVAIKPRNYLFFTGGSNNEKLYYYDAVSETIVKEYTTFSSRINVITASDDGNQIAVGLDDGSFVLYDISNATIVSGTPKELHRFDGMGRVIDIVQHNGKIN